MLEEIKMLCITCPKGCTLKVTRDGETIVVLKAGCKRGDDYARRELVDPRRMVATTVRVKQAIHPLLPVYTTAPFPKSQIQALLAALRAVELVAPVRMGNVVLQDALHSGIDVIASRDLS